MSDQGAAVGGTDNEVPSLPIGGRLNAVKHGLTAKTPVLPGEDPDALQALIDGFKANAQAKNLIEESLLEMAARCFWRAGRAERLEANRGTIDIVRRAETDAARAAQEVAALGSRLYFDCRGPWQLWPWRDYYCNPPRKSSAGDAEDPDGPRKVVDQLEATREGVNWLLREWYEIRKPLEAGGEWLPCQKFKAIRLLGKQPLDAIHDDEVALVFLANHAIAPDFFSAFDELRCEIDEDRLELHMAQLEREERKAITPADEEGGRAALLAIVDKAIERLWTLGAERGEVADFLEQLQSQTPSDAGTKAVAPVQRHLGDCNRLMLRNIDAFHRLRRNEVEGWGEVRQEREQKKEEARRKRARGPDPRLIVDARGTVRQAEGYRWRLQEGLARYEAVIGRQPCELDEGWSESPWNDARTGKDLDGTPTQGGALCVEEGVRAGVTDDGARATAEVGTQAGFQGESAGGGVIDCVPVQFAGKGDAASLQNENDGSGVEGDRVIGQGADDDLSVRGLEDPRRAEETFSRGDSGDPPGAQDSRRSEIRRHGRVTEDGGWSTLVVGARVDFRGGSASVGQNDCVPVELTGKADWANLQDEIGAWFNGCDGEVAMLMDPGP